MTYNQFGSLNDKTISSQLLDITGPCLAYLILVFISRTCIYKVMHYSSVEKLQSFPSNVAR
jgi:hypothetical protein